MLELHMLVVMMSLSPGVAQCVQATETKSARCCWRQGYGAWYRYHHIPEIMSAFSGRSASGFKDPLPWFYTTFFDHSC
jgi:hypothetical protein